ncbi:MAG: glycosyltransferase [Candidatus Marinimicrobia bacterium]|jgi:glycosyltransferase involved in cell wall biosynthesis|nr:glycosyltransferase [Candidatus Neomarinimicrobiota bacterium]MBT7091650.1 glycosyltransferase [Bacteroidota bacterium]MBT4362753.1 glycosyltransferase [Candidatus Neomarinimicrobiota bacterium]MBT4715243.1 glycosyltransferase [Candidatus Neomarinimicrobiota bacterium]MBT4947412.1 glycosyltransferase [Candidatus Neomarinimicrobiota bacterium]
MKILHLNYLPSAIVLKDKKIKDMAEAALNADLDFEFVILNTTIEAREKNLSYVKIPFPANRLLKVFTQKLFRYRYIEKYTDMDKFDRIVLRYPLAFGFGLKRFYKKYGHKIFTEHHTNEGAELLKIGSVPILGRVFSWYENYRKGTILKKCRGVIGVTDEIRQHELSFCSELASHTMSNGINVASVKPSRNNEDRDVMLNIIFLAARFAPWHGLDYAIRGLKKYSGITPIVLHVVGNINQISSLIEFADHKNAKIKYHGELHGDELDTLFDQVDLGISSLGIHRVGLEEASVLKSREYFARGLPFVYAYSDSDLTEDEEYALRVQVKESNYLNFEELVNFFQSTQKIPELGNVMRVEAIKKIDWAVKLKKLHNFVVGN